LEGRLRIQLSVHGPFYFGLINRFGFALPVDHRGPDWIDVLLDQVARIIGASRPISFFRECCEITSSPSVVARLLRIAGFSAAAEESRSATHTRGIVENHGIKTFVLW
jgi:hypothetical protein